jgi:hypothetical protein
VRWRPLPSPRVPLRSVVDQRGDTRRCDAVLDPALTPDDRTAVCERLPTAWAHRDVLLQGLPTAGAPLSPEPLRPVLGAVPHPLGPFPVLQARTQGLRCAVAAERHRLAPSQPQRTRGRPSSQETMARRWARPSQTRQDQLRGWLPGRGFFVTRPLQPSARQQRWPSTPGCPQWRPCRDLLEHLEAWLDRRCRTQSARAQLKPLRPGVQRCTWRGDTVTTVLAPPLDQALTCLDDQRVPATANAVDRGNRRHRKRQNSVDRVRSHISCEGRIARDMMRESRAANRDRPTHALHQARRGSP